MTDLQAMLAIAVTAADRAADVIRTHAPAELTAKGDRDYASDVDFRVEREVRAFLANATPGVGFLGEEEGHTGTSGSLHWALDPIDGTVNFANALPLCAVSLALVDGDKPIAGVVHLPFLGNVYTAAAGQGAYRRGKPITVASPAKVHDAIVSIGDYAVGDEADSRNVPRLRLTQRLAGKALRVRMFGSAAIDLTWLAEGITGAMVMFSNKPWDTAAGVIIAKEAGAAVVDIDGTPHTMQSSATIAAAPSIVDEVLDIVQSAAASTTS
ncbi:inositol monophosphatase family protein [Hamadaea tsunoensis]|uniref:inositol monophosphatase family protein n=1 Tax=Hamadaea tsunoensis TaxID=53368 RepID=UPI00041D623D|nr:inositol monophosphatase [Hamadaea tsunoensis]